MWGARPRTVYNEGLRRSGRQERRHQWSPTRLAERRQPDRPAAWYSSAPTRIVRIRSSRETRVLMLSRSPAFTLAAHARKLGRAAPRMAVPGDCVLRPSKPLLYYVTNRAVVRPSTSWLPRQQNDGPFKDEKLVGRQRGHSRSFDMMEEVGATSIKHRQFVPVISGEMIYVSHLDDRTKPVNVRRPRDPRS